MPPRGGSSLPGRAAIPAGATVAGGKAAGGAAAGAATGSGAQAGVVGSAEALMTAATAVAAAAGAVLPPALMVAFEFKLSSGKPANIMKAAYAYDNAADDLQTAASELRELVRSIPEQTWSANDRERYESNVHEYSLQLDYLHNYLMAVSIALTVVAWALFVYATFATGMAAYLGALAAASAFPPNYAACLPLAATALTVTHVATGILLNSGLAAAAVLGGGAAITADKQGDHGNQFAGDAFKKALANGAKSGAANLLQNAGNAALSFVNRAENPIGTQAKKPIPVKEIDLDYDRDKDGNVSVGGGAKFTAGPVEHELGGHRKYDGSGKYTGTDAEYKAKFGIDPTETHNAVVGGKGDWKPGDWKPDSASGTAGYENARTGHKAGLEGGRKDGGWEGKVNGVGPGGSAELSGSTKKPAKPVDDTPPWDK
ncbi:hypothetical protein [Actinomadura yumaensis]|uniref:Bacterial toxin 24 domain-containing protein n=3 Tax=Actinomadura TaxID=1988 RepID=A0ABW2CKM9_9ACTN